MIVNQTVTQMYVQPPKTTIAIGSSPLQYYVLASDQFSNPISLPTVMWSVSGGGTISSSGLFTPTTDGTFTVTAVSGITATTTVTVTGSPPAAAPTPGSPVVPIAPIVPVLGPIFHTPPASDPTPGARSATSC